MHIQRLALENFRSARNLSIDLDARLNVFVGMNGAGKSTVLDAAAILLSWFVNRIATPRASGRPIPDLDITNDESQAGLEIQLHLAKEEFAWRLAKGHRSKSTASSLGGATLAADAVHFKLDSGAAHSLPLVAYYPVNRAVLDIPLRIRGKHKFDMLDANDGSLSGGANFRTFFEWFRAREDLENESRRDLENGDKTSGQCPDPQLEAVRSALQKLMPDFKHPTVRRNPLHMEITKRGQALWVNQLSDGEKCLMAMVGDLARRLAIANPQKADPLQGSGIVLIDELDLHLHPKWQRDILPRLQKVFKRCQFLVSTHSPHVLTHVQREHIFLLDTKAGELQVQQPSESYGKTAVRILEDLMGLETTRPDEVASKIRKIFDLIHDGDLKAATAAIDALQMQIGSDPDLVRASVLVERKKHIGK